MRIYISLPISGYDLEFVDARCLFAKTMIEKKGHTPVSPRDLDHPDITDYPAMIGRDLSELLSCDAVLFLEDWEQSRGCRLEYHAAVIYDKMKFYSYEEVPDNENIR